MPSKSKIYLDFNATTGPSLEVREYLRASLDDFGNPSSIHWAGQSAKTKVREARQKLALALGVNPLELVWTSGGSESNSTILRGVFESITTHPKLSGRNEFITTQVEHPSVLKTFQWLQSRGAIVHFLKVNREGQIDLAQYESLLSEKTALVSVMFANNETGSIFPIKEMAVRAREKGALFHSDCVQALGKIPLHLGELGLDYASFSGHKFYSLKGSGVLFVKKGSPYEPLIRGGGQERHRRGGTENVLGISCLGVAVESLKDLSAQTNRLEKLRNEFEARVLQEIPAVQITAGQGARLANTSSLVIAGVDGETLLMSLDLKGFAVSTGAACSSGNPEPSPVLLAMGLSRLEAQSSLRVSLGWTTTEEEMNEFFEALKATVLRLRSLHQKSEGSLDVVS